MMEGERLAGLTTSMLVEAGRNSWRVVEEVFKEDGLVALHVA